MKNDMDLLRDMLRYAEEAVSMAENRTEEDLLLDKAFNYAIQHCYTIIGEAASLVSEPTKQRFPTIPWHEIVGMRNWIVHRYQRVNPKMLWSTTQNDLPKLIKEILDYLPPEQT